VLLWFYARKPRLRGQVAAAFLFGYGLFRFIAEYWREPDAQLGFLSLGLSMGQWLSIPMLLAGVALWVWAGRRGISDVQEPSDEPADKVADEKSTGAVEESSEPVDEAGETTPEDSKTPSQS
jgi:prolipoprotein diacylglyceryl transferase